MLITGERNNMQQHAIAICSGESCKLPETKLKRDATYWRKNISLFRETQFKPELISQDKPLIRAKT